MSKLAPVQRRWQSAALEVLLRGHPLSGRGPWIPASYATDEIRERAGCTAQAATGALRALLTVGLADRCETSEGLFWKATEAAERFFDLAVAPLHEELAAINERLGGIDQNLDDILWMQSVRENLKTASDQGRTR